jgi:FG-GAP-like repeat
VVSWSARSISLLLGNGDGTFQAPLFLDTGAPVPRTETRSIALGDFNSDGSQNLVATNDSAASVSVLLGKGDGTFRAPSVFGTGGSSVSVVVGDFNSDHLQDLAVTGSFPGTAVLLVQWEWNVRHAIKHWYGRSSHRQGRFQ